MEIYSEEECAYARFMDGREMMIFVKMLFGRSMVLDVRHTDTVAMVKSYIQDSQGISAENMILVFAGIFLDDSRTLSEYNIVAESSVSLIIKDQSAKAEEKSVKENTI